MSAYDLQRAVIISHADGGFNRKHGLKRIEQAAQAARIPHHAVCNLQQLEDVLTRCPDATSILVVNAGDGTVCKIIEQLRTRPLFKEEPVLALLQGGTTNMIHKDVGWRGEPASSLYQLLAGTSNQRVTVRHRQPLRIDQAGQPTRYGFFFATNAIVRGILQTRDQLHRRGLTGRAVELLSVLRVLGKLLLRKVANDPILAPASLEVTVDGQTRPGKEQVFLLAFTLHKLILGLEPLRHGQSAGMSILDWPGYRIGRWITNLIRGKLEGFNSLTLQGRFSWVLDGEIYDHSAEAGPITIVLADPVQFLVPKR